MQNTIIYLDYMASTPMDRRVVDAMHKVMTLESKAFANPSSTHAAATIANELIDKSKIQIAETIKCKSDEIIFTSGATEANNLALLGVAKQYHQSGRHIITVANEHKAILDPCKQLEKEGFKVTYLNPNHLGLLDLEDLKRAITDQTILVSVMWVNNETGMINPMQAIAKIVKEKGVLLHCDAAQAVGKVPMDFEHSAIDLLSLAAHKCYGPKGIGALVIRSNPRVRLQPLMFGGGQQFSLRPGTLATHQIVGMGEAFETARMDFDKDQAHIQSLRDQLWRGIQTLDGVHLNGDLEHRVAANLNVSFEGVNGESLLCALRSLLVSTGSACNAASVLPSHVLLSMGIHEKLAASSVRFSLGRMTTKDEIDQAISIIQKAVTQLRVLAPKGEA
jgi:cysteine desulfurase